MFYIMSLKLYLINYLMSRGGGEFVCDIDDLDIKIVFTSKVFKHMHLNPTFLEA